MFTFSTFLYQPIQSRQQQFSEIEFYRISFSYFPQIFPLLKRMHFVTRFCSLVSLKMNQFCPVVVSLERLKAINTNSLSILERLLLSIAICSLCRYRRDGKILFYWHFMISAFAFNCLSIKVGRRQNWHFQTIFLLALLIIQSAQCILGNTKLDKVDLS